MRILKWYYNDVVGDLTLIRNKTFQ